MWQAVPVGLLDDAPVRTITDPFPVLEIIHVGALFADAPACSEVGPLSMSLALRDCSLRHCVSVVIGDHYLAGRRV